MNPRCRICQNYEQHVNGAYCTKVHIYIEHHNIQLCRININREQL